MLLGLIVQKYANPGFNDPLRVYDLFSNDSLNPAYDTYSGLQTYCNWTQFRKRKQDVYQSIPEISIYPNPANTVLNVENIPADMPLRILDVTGRQMLYHDGTMHSTQLDLTSLLPGMYLISVSGSNKKFIKQ